MEEAVEVLSNEISALTQKMDSIGIEIYQLSSAINSLKYCIEHLRSDS